MELKLRDYQVEDTKFMTQRRRVINANDPGLGKTLETLTAMKNLKTSETLVICPKIATGVWQYEADKWYGWKGLIYTGTPKQRKELMQEYLDGQYDMLITNPAMMKEVQEYDTHWETIVVDEAHLCGLLNHKTQKFKTMKQFVSNNLFILTGTPIRRNPADLWSMLHLVEPKKFKAYWPFVRKYCNIIETPFGKEIAGVPKVPLEFHKMWKDHMIRRKKAEVLHDLPEKIMQPYPILLEGKQKKLYQELVKDMILETDDDMIITPNKMVQILRLRQLLICPKILGIDEEGAALQALVEDLLPQEFDAERAVVICTPFRQAVPFIKEAIQTRYNDVIIEEIHGDIKDSANDVALRFQSHKTHRKVLIFTIKSGASWTAHSASTAFFLGCEYSMSDNDQAFSRIHRLGQQKSVHIKFLLYKDTVDDLVMTNLDGKALAANWILEPHKMMAKVKQLQSEYKKKKK